jgi:uncharacterized protein YcfJ
MYKFRKAAFLLPVLVLLAGCETAGPRTQTGAVAGGLLGATAGGIIGHQSGHGLGGAGIGAAVGALSGALVGSTLDQQAARQDAVMARQNQNYLSITAIADMAGRGVPDDVIIEEIRRTGSSYRLTSETITYLKKSNVSDRVINYMLASSGY